MGMTQEEAIRRIEDHIRIHSKQEPFRGCHIQEALEMAVNALKAQEPRVMTLEEVKEGEAYWLEMRGIASEYAICKLNDHGDSAFLDFAVQFGCKTLESEGYGKTWRCWTSRPTDEQRRNEPWEQ